jgi:long-subunit fatty acid transport protein
MMHLGPLGAALCLIVTLIAFGSPPAEAQEWALNSSLSQRFLYDDNLFLTPTDEVSSFGSLTTPRLTLSRTSPTSKVTFDSQFPYQAYFGHSELNSFDQLVDLSGSKALSERSTVELGANFDRRTNIRSEFDDTDSFVPQKFRRTAWGLSPSWTYLLSPIDSVNLGASFQDVSYDTIDRVDYRTYGSVLGYSHQLSELAQVTAQLTYNRFEPDVPTDRLTNVFGGSVGYRYSPSERFLISGAAGLSYDVTTEDGRPDDTGFGFLFNFDFKYRVTEQLDARLTLVHDTEPSGDGRQTARSRASLSLDYELTELTTLRVDARYTDNEDYLGGASSNSGNTRFVSLNPSINWDVTEDLRLGAEYEYRHKTNGNGDANSNAVFLTLRYALPDLKWGGF